MKVGKKISLQNLISWTNSENLSYQKIEGGENIDIESVSTDSRTLQEGDFFIPVKGENFDGHDFIAEAVKRGCCGFVFDQDFSRKLEIVLKDHGKNILKNLIILKTDNIISFLLNLSAGYISKLPVKVIGITGSAGKTTTKEFIVNILSDDFEIAFTPKNYNTELGISMAVLAMSEKTRFFIAEMGMRASGQLLKLSELLDIKIGAITSVGASHLEFFNDVSEIALAKAEIAQVIALNGGVLYLNRDDEWTRYILEHIKNKNLAINLKEYGRNNNLDFNFIEKRADNLGRYSFEFFKKAKKLVKINMPVAGYHNVYNACCAAAVCMDIGASAMAIKNGIEKTLPEGSRMRVFIKADKTIIDDCYNASPLSMKGAIDTLKCISSSGKSRSVALLADMMELGLDAKRLHYELGQYLSANNIDVLIAYGKLSGNICKGFEDEGRINKAKGKNLLIYHFDNMEKMCSKINKILKPKDTILVKGSRANKLETVLEYI